jgi:adenosylmethionine-8-amino-7-oxononanoate aminotransferase
MKPVHGISLYAASGCVDGIRGDHVLLAPPYNVTKDEIDIIVETAGKVIEEVFVNIGII